jgi:PKD repeat protein
MKKYLIPLILLLAAALFVLPAAAAITADFSYSVDSSNPLTVQFTDKSTGNVGNWFWMSNDQGASSNIKNPSHTFSGDGEYRITLAAQAPNYDEPENTKIRYLLIRGNTVTETDGNGNPIGGSSSGGGSSGGGISLPDISFGGISIPNPRWTSSASTSNSSA